METEEDNNSIHEKYAELSKKSLVRVQYSCSGNDNGINEEEYIPIVNSNPINVCTENENKTKNS